MSIQTLQQLIVASITEQFGPPLDPTGLEKFAAAIAQAVITELTTNATVLVTGVTSGVETAPGTIIDS